MNEERNETDTHLTDAELFALAAPAAGEPEALPPHLSRCRDCARALKEWKAAMGAVGEADAGELGRRSDEEWRAAEDATLARIRRAGNPRHSVHAWRWALAAAASLLVAALVLSGRRAAPSATASVIHATPSAAVSAATSQDMTADDAADDRLLRDASYLAGGGDVDSGSGLEARL
jgi:anti-sigma-K factor RskA